MLILLSLLYALRGSHPWDGAAHTQGALLNLFGEALIDRPRGVFPW